MLFYSVFYFTINSTRVFDLTRLTARVCDVYTCVGYVTSNTHLWEVFG